MNIPSGRAVSTSLCILGLCAAIQAMANLTLVTDKSRIEFTGTKPGAAHKGGFKQFSADGNIDWEDLSKSSFKINIDAASLWSDDGGLAAHLKTPDFFDVKRHPNIGFESQKIEINTSDARTAIVVGKLSMLDRTMEVAIPSKIELTDTGLTVKSRFKIDRTQWGMHYGKGRIDDEVEITATFVFGRQ